MAEVRTPTKEQVTLVRSEYRELRNWLQKTNCYHHYSKFVDNGITHELVTELDTAGLKEMGITKIGDRLRLEIAINSLKAERLATNAVRVDDLERMVTEAVGDGVYGPTALPLALVHRPTEMVHDDDMIAPLPRGADEVTTPKEPTLRDKTVTFILQDGSAKKVNILGCFNAQLVKRKVLKKLGLPQEPYDAYIHLTANSREAIVLLLFDVELVTICYLPERDERHRIMLCPHGSHPLEQAQEVSRKVFGRQAKATVRMRDLSEYHIPPEPAAPATAAQRLQAALAAQLRNFFGQRPPSELISSNLAEYFPETRQKDLEQTVRNSVRHLVRLSKRINIAPGVLSLGLLIALANFSANHLTQMFNPTANYGRRMLDLLSFSTAALGRKNLVRTIGDVMVNNITAIDEAVDQQLILLKLPSINLSEVRLIILVTLGALRMPVRMPYAATFAETSGGNRSSRIELFNVDYSDDELEEDDEGAFNNASQSLGGINGPKHWLKGARIGAGSFGTVFLGMNPFTGELMAVKQIPLPKKNSKGDVESTMMEQEREMTLLKQLNHENIVRYYGLSTDDVNLNIFLEYVPGGSVQLMLKLYGPFEEPLIRNFIRQVLIGLLYLHGEDIIHRDIKGANILIDIKGTVKIGDFGISKKVSTLEEESQQNQQQPMPPRRLSLQGLVYWMAPEVVKQTAYTKKADIWSVGCLIVEMFTGKHPFPEFSQMQAIFKIGTHISPQIPEWCTDEGKEFLGMTFEMDYNKRPDAVDLLAMPFLSPLIMSKT